MIYFDSAATTLQKPASVPAAVADAIDTMTTPGRGDHPAARMAADLMLRCRMEAAELFDVPTPENVILTSNATHGLNIAIRSLVSPGDTVVISGYEHNAVTRPLRDIGRVSCRIVNGRLFDPHQMIEGFRRAVDGGVKAVICTHTSNVFGYTLPMDEIAGICRERGVPLIVDASQTAGALPIDMEAMGVDVLCFTGHKGLMGPQGTGGLCVRPGVEIEPWKVGGSGVHSYDRRQPREYPTRLEAGTLNGHGIAGLSAALDFLQEVGVEAIEAKERALMDRFYQAVSALDGVTVYGDFSQARRSAIVALNIRDYDSAAVSDELSETYGIATRPGAHCAPRMHQALGTTDRGAVRFSFSWFNTQEEVDEAIRAIGQLAEE